jgi:hypothetical protein
MQQRTRQLTLFSAKMLLSIGGLFHIALGPDSSQLRVHLLAIDPALSALALALIGIQTFFLRRPMGC